MKLQIWSLLCGSLIGAGCLINSPTVFAEDNIPEGGEVLGRGPIHEAFAQPLEEQAGQAAPAVPKAPPEPIEELPPEQKPEGDAVQWVPGYWQWDDARGEFLWVSGLWREPPPGRKWVPGSWREVDGKWQYSPGFWAPETMDGLNYQPPPPASVDEGPVVAAPSEDSFYVPGLWIYRETRYVWRPGYWLRCRPDWCWSPAHYVYTPAGCLFVPGYWDYPLERRGCLFASVYFGPHHRPRYWSPSYTIGCDFLHGALFARRGCGYYYGDYFGATYRAAGYTPWIDVRVGRFGVDPLYGQYRAVRAGRSWDNNLRGLYADRHAGRAARPPHTLAQQRTVVRDLRSRNASADVSHVNVLRSFSQTSVTDRKLVDVSREERTRHQHTATQLRSAGRQRATAEREVIVKHETPKANSAPRHVSIDLPKSHSAPRTTEHAPPRPRHTDTHKPAEKTFTPRIENPRPVDRQPREIHLDKPRPKIEQPQPKHIETPRHVQPAPRHIDPPKVSQPKVIPAPKKQSVPHVEVPRHEPKHVAAPRVQSQPKVSAPPVIHHAPKSPPAQVTRPASHSRPAVQHAPQRHSAPKPSHSGKPRR